MYDCDSVEFPDASMCSTLGLLEWLSFHLSYQPPKSGLIGPSVAEVKSWDSLEALNMDTLTFEQWFQALVLELAYLSDYHQELIDLALNVYVLH